MGLSDDSGSDWWRVDMRHDKAFNKSERGRQRRAQRMFKAVLRELSILSQSTGESDANNEHRVRNYSSRKTR